jgi:hypothetical protein
LDRYIDQRQHAAERREDIQFREGDRLHHDRFDGWTLGVGIATVLVLAATLAFISWQTVLTRQGIMAAHGDAYFERSLGAISEAYRLLEETFTGMELDPKKGNLRNWDSAAQLLKSAQVFGRQLTGTPYEALFERLELPKWRSQFSRLLRLPISFEYGTSFTVLGMGEQFKQAVDSARVVDYNEFIGERQLAVVYRFARNQDQPSDTVGEEPAFDEATQAPHPILGTPGLYEYITALRQCNMHGRPERDPVFDPPKWASPTAFEKWLERLLSHLKSRRMN